MVYPVNAIQQSVNWCNFKFRYIYIGVGQNLYEGTTSSFIKISKWSYGEFIKYYNNHYCLFNAVNGEIWDMYYDFEESMYFIIEPVQ